MNIIFKEISNFAERCGILHRRSIEVTDIRLKNRIEVVLEKRNIGTCMVTDNDKTGVIRFDFRCTDFKYDAILNDIRFEADTILGLRIFTID
jgi:hypothetical protein